MADFVISKPLSQNNSIKHGFFKRTGGHSDGIYASLNCGTYSGDHKDTILKNRSLACSTFSKNAKLIELHQIHSNKVVVYDENYEIADADGIVTDRRDIALSVVTADCAPVLFADANAGVIGAAHAGWKGAHTGVLDNTVDKMCVLGANRKNITAVIGPCIAQNSYEVGPDFFNAIDNEKYFLSSNNPDHHMFDLSGYVFDKLKGCGIGLIDALNIDTYDKKNDFFSYRRKTHLNENDYGRQISIILQK
ncbi:peptidoglycan editing factor PgeF [Pseudemcibacter aquimaris]|uniref:peptidoglycan editing factor PgeF n=1 Tax=Pseudemcibacter aquimaris TaxID=2857064 RepID=UPI0020138C70|nr:peptidoglycan editing factor PgeF [Pseudemcibacter aquimaris]MCC3861003.1 peptidoglycan editing factor PgeF [Pseudemcibacter aquimaris]WDU59821.1 peptidoglycan editing factor PgeF [Pseudemcibacter aquimaris]